MARGRHANPATGAFGGAPYGATMTMIVVMTTMVMMTTMMVLMMMTMTMTMMMAMTMMMMMRGGRRQREEGGGERGAPSLQNEDPTPQDGWEQYEINLFQFQHGRFVVHVAKCMAGMGRGAHSEGNPIRGVLLLLLPY